MIVRTTLLILLWTLMGEMASASDSTLNKDQCEKTWQGYYVENKGETPVCMLSNRSRAHQITLKECNQYKEKYGAVIVTNDSIGKTAKFCEFKRPEYPDMIVRRMIDESQIIDESLLPAWKYCVETWKKNIGATDDPLFKIYAKDKLDREAGQPLSAPECFTHEPALTAKDCKRYGGAPWGPYCRFRNLERPVGSGIKVTYFQNLIQTSPLHKCTFGLEVSDAIYSANPCPADIVDACTKNTFKGTLYSDLALLTKEQADYEDYLKQLTPSEPHPSQKVIDEKIAEFKSKEDSIKNQISDTRLRMKVLVNQKDDYVTQCQRQSLGHMGIPPATFDEAFASGKVKLLVKPIPKKD